MTVAAAPAPEKPKTRRTLRLLLALAAVAGAAVLGHWSGSRAKAADSSDIRRAARTPASNV